MKMIVPCPQCITGENRRIQFAVGELRNDMTIAAICPDRHETFVIVQNQRFELLFESAAFALLDGYPREAVASFTASLERFYEFFVRVVLHRRAIRQEDVNGAWKLVAQQSERQFGAFCFLYLLETGKPFELPDKLPPFRNSVIHKGYIPSTEEVNWYGEQILNIIEEAIQILRENSLQAIDEIKLQQIREANRLVDEGVQPLSQAGLVMLDITCRRDINAFNFQERLRKLKEHRDSLLSHTAEELKDA